tara:strand:- start:985 stop:1875 length:891 start_codon:yes stop_codon:yes gene_type:complete
MSFKSSWTKYQNSISYPTKARNIIHYDYADFEAKVLNKDPVFTDNLVKSLLMGDFFILKNAYTKKFMNELKINAFNYFKDSPSDFYKMLEGTPDFHRKIDLETGKKYSFRSCKHSFYFYPWNKDPLNLFKPIYSRWRIIKTVMGLESRSYEKNTPKDGVVDRIQVVKYPSKIGFLEPHTDPYKYQKLIISSYMSKKGVDFEGIGFYLIDENDNVMSVEDSIDIGDIGIGMATLYHGVAPVNILKEADWEDVNDGRWFLSLYSNESDEVDKRHTSSGVSEKLIIKSSIKNQIFPIGI